MKDQKKVNTFEFDPEDIGNNIQCTYDFGNHPQLPVYQHCARCLFTRGILIPLCTMCGFRKNGLKLCNSCWEETSEANKTMKYIEETING